jgi:hypothetical protein
MARGYQARAAASRGPGAVREAIELDASALHQHLLERFFAVDATDGRHDAARVADLHVGAPLGLHHPSDKSRSCFGPVFGESGGAAVASVSAICGDCAATACLARERGLLRRDLLRRCVEVRLGARELAREDVGLVAERVAVVAVARHRDKVAATWRGTFRDAGARACAAAGCAAS